MLNSLTIHNFKSIVDLTLELGRFNVFIGENGCGKTNILEALGMAAGASARRLTNEDMIARGLRVAKPSLMMNAFADGAAGESVTLKLGFPVPGQDEGGSISLELEADARTGGWGHERRIQRLAQEFGDALSQTAAGKQALQVLANRSEAEVTKLIDLLDQTLGLTAVREAQHEESSRLESYAIFCANTLALRGLDVQSRRDPMGIYGEAIDVAIARMPPDVRAELVEHAKLISWLEDIELDQEGARKLAGYKPGRSLSDLFFVDRFLAQDRCAFSAENANEGILHILFHLVLFLHPETPSLFAIDNIESSLNPHLLRRLVTTLASLAKERDRQALVTTHNPAVLDGLNLNDDAQRLFVVYRDDDGHTKARRVQVKPEATVDGMKLKLSELWMRGMMGAIPTHF